MKRFFVIITLAAAGLSAWAAEQVTFTDGAQMVVDRVSRERGLVHLHLNGGGLMAVPAGRILSVTPFTLPSPPPATRPGAELASLPFDVKFEGLIASTAAEFGLDPTLVAAVIHTESRFKVRAESPKGAMGLMQLMPQTARRFGVDDPWDAEQNIRGGVAYLAWLTDRFGNDLELILAAYNAGEGAVDKYGGIPPYKETRNYVRIILGLLNS